ncbi:topoisomerase II-associated protein [Serpula lacrymans var. lacrymans S7.9]|uniref:Topoisomerase II-associated protein n=1 Tax=Serpula lacrymans var. lacrymans (strain S7.9) TaxID=578457 RepID=F8P3I1_SERL9|nr:topoisomerase II-associated protein [Serpula lacrymans var. lacrymans S7.9]EGO22680.1 topoisomerase II-associated protein [Serpula lacrymans var. lacrymans S7.9]
MSFFGFEEGGLEHEKKKFLEGGLKESEDVAVYTWGEESYDGLGDALLEGGDELNDETFGATGAIGKDFDFSSQNLPVTSPSTGRVHDQHSRAIEQQPRERTPRIEVTGSSPSVQPHAPPADSLESIWDDKSPFAILSRMNGAGHSADHQRAPSASKSPFLPSATNDNRAIGHQTSIPQGVNHTGVRTLQEIEAEMHAIAQQQEQLRRQQEQQEHLRQNQLQQQDLLRLQQLQQLQQRTPPPRMLSHSQSPRFHAHQILQLQQEQERQQQHRLHELQEQLRMEELERHVRAQQVPAMQHQGQSLGRRQTSFNDLQAAQGVHQRRIHSPAFVDQQHTQNSQNAQLLPHNIQLQQRLLSEMAQAEFMRDMQGVSPAEQEQLRAEAMRKIMETERMEERRRRKAAKIAHMSRYNDLMTQSDKDFITRIQVSQLVTQDPYAEDFYAQVYGAILRSRLGLQSQDERVLKFGSGGGVGLGLAQKGGGRRQSAMQKMEAQVERIVSNARLREKEKALHSLQGALGKTSGRSYKAAPRQLLQVEAANATTPTMSGAHPHISKEDAIETNGEGAAREAAKLGREALGAAAGTDGVVKMEPLAQRQVLVILESLYDLVLSVEQLRRDQPPEEDEVAFNAWQMSYEDLTEQLWINLKVMVPLETSDPHPFVSLLTPAKGKKILPRLSRHISGPRMLTLLTLLVACFSQLDVFKQAGLLDSVEDTPERQEVDRQTQAFLGSVMQSILPVVAKAELRLVSGLLGLFLDRCDVVAAAQTKPGIAILTLFLSRVEVIKQNMSTVVDSPETPTPEEAQQWQLMFDHLFQLVAPHFLALFPSARLASALPLPSHGPAPPSSSLPTDIIDQPIWQFLAALALHASSEQQQILVSTLREKVLENVTSVSKGWVADEEEGELKLANVNLFLHALGLDSSQIEI